METPSKSLHDKVSLVTGPCRGIGRPITVPLALLGPEAAVDYKGLLQEETAGGYVASKRSRVFHRPDCKAAAKILAGNLVRYATRDEGVETGKGPCHECEP